MNRKTITKETRFRVLCVLTVFFIFAVLLPAGQSQGREITDMFGRKFSVAEKPRKVYSASPPMTNLLYAIDPTMLAGLTVPIREYEKPYLHKEMLSLPLLGGWYGQANTPNMEMILKVKPEFIVVQKFGSAFSSKTNEMILKAIPSPVIAVNLTNVYDYPAAIMYLGRLLGREARAKELTSYTRKAIADMKAFAAGIDKKKKVSVYYAEGVDGLNTDCDASMHTELINLAGGRNVFHCAARDLFGMEKISMEQVMLYDPDVILIFEKTFYRKIFGDRRWQRLRAVKNKRVYLIPNQPFNWFDRPPSFMRLLGAKWVASLLYPDRYRIDMVKETQKFFKLFLGVNLSADEAKKLMYQ
ncbi:MAG: ABC transporter substrate-binding protein [Smithella sp.]